MNSDALDELEKLLAKATPGSWRADDEGHVYPEMWDGVPNRESLALIAMFSPWSGASQGNRDEVMAQASANLALSIAIRNAAPSIIRLARLGLEVEKEKERAQG